MEILNQVYAQIGDAFTDKVTVTDDITKLDENPLSIIKSSDLTTDDVLVGGILSLLLQLIKSPPLDSSSRAFIFINERNDDNGKN